MDYSQDALDEYDTNDNNEEQVEDGENKDNENDMNTDKPSETNGFIVVSSVIIENEDKNAKISGNKRKVDEMQNIENVEQPPSKKVKRD